MKFVKTDDLEKGMRLARPIYNRNGVLLYDRNTRLTSQGINSVRNFNLIGIYVLEPTEPLPPMSEEDVEFERFQTMSVFGLREDIELLSMGKNPANLENMVDVIYKKYGRKDLKLSTLQNIRSSEDYTYKHALFVAILSAAMSVRLKLSEDAAKEVIKAALVHDIGFQAVVKLDSISNSVKMIIDYENKMDEEKNIVNMDARKSLQAKILLTADAYDDMTSMKADKEPSTDVAAVRYFLKHVEKYDDNIVGALVDSLKMLYPGICVELTNHEKGIVIVGNESNVLRPVILGFNGNYIYNLMQDDVYEEVQIKDIMKTMDKRIHIDKATIDEFMAKFSGKF